MSALHHFFSSKNETKQKREIENYHFNTIIKVTGDLVLVTNIFFLEPFLNKEHFFEIKAILSLPRGEKNLCSYQCSTLVLLLSLPRLIITHPPSLSPICPCPFL